MVASPVAPVQPIPARLTFGQKLPFLVKGLVFGLIGSSATLLWLGNTGNTVVVPAAAAFVAGWLMVGNSVLELIELILMPTPETNHKLIIGFKTITLVLSAIVPLVLLTSVVRDPDIAVKASIVILGFLALVDAIEAYYM